MRGLRRLQELPTTRGGDAATMSHRGLRGISQALLAMTAVFAAMLGVVAALPVSALANLPDSRIYEQVSPPNKNGNIVCGVCFEIAAASGNAVSFRGYGAMGVSAQSNFEQFIARRTPGVGWRTAATATRTQEPRLSIFVTPNYIVPSHDYSSDVFQAGTYSTEQLSGPFAGLGVGLFITGENPLLPPIWAGRPTTAETPRIGGGYLTAGTTPDLSKVYFGSGLTLTPEDATREAGWGFYEWKPEDEGGLVNAGELPDKSLSKYGAVAASLAGWEYGSRYPGEFRGANFDNQISEDGMKAFFVSPDPAAGAPEPPQLYVRESEPGGGHHAVLISRSELPGSEGQPAPHGPTRMQNTSQESRSATYAYASRDGSNAFFASTDQLTTDAPSGSLYTASVGAGAAGGTFKLSTQVGENPPQPTSALAYNASAAEVQAALSALSNVGAGNVRVTGFPGEYTIGFNLTIGLSVDSSGLTACGTCAAGSQTATVIADQYKTYDFDLATEELTYMPGVGGPNSEYCNFGSPACDGSGIAAAARDGSRVMFMNQSTSPWELDAWSRGPNGGSVQRLIRLSNATVYQHGFYGPRASDDGSVFVFGTAAPVEPLDAGAEPFNSGGQGEIYRYALAEGERPAELSCVSCPPAGVNASGSAVVSHDNNYNSNAEGSSLYDTRIMSADGTRVFFDTPDPLVAADTDGVRDVYEWENGSIYLISAGTSVADTNFLDNSESGGDVFFVTKDGISLGDTDGGEDVYDARTPQPGDNPPPKAVPCEGDVCQGPPSVPQLLTPAASAEFNGLGNIPPEEVKETTTPAPKVTCKKGFVKKNGKCVKKKKKRKAAKGKAKGNRGGK